MAASAISKPSVAPFTGDLSNLASQSPVSPVDTTETSSFKSERRKKPKLPKKERPPSSLEQRFWDAWEQRKLYGVTMVREFQFHPVRKFRFDFAIPSLKIAIEIDGYGIGHAMYNRIAQSHIKQNLAVECGWVVLRHTTTTLSSKAKRDEAIDQLWRIIQEKWES